MFKKDDTFHAVIGVEVRKCHYLATVDDDHHVFKWYSKFKQRWVYQVESELTIEMLIESVNRLATRN